MVFSLFTIHSTIHQQSSKMECYKQYIKKNKASNFSPDEITKLNDLVAKYAAVLFNKKTDTGTNKQKIATWERISSEFNSSLPGLIPRSASQLRLKFANLKRVASTEWSNVVQEQRKTGGGPPPSDVSDTTLWLKGILQTSMVGEASTSDCDGYPGMFSNPSTTTSVPAIDLVEVNEAEADGQGVVAVQVPTAVPLSSDQEEEEDDLMSVEKPIFKRKMASPLVTGSKKKCTVTPAILRRNLSTMTKRKIEYFDESQDTMKRKDAREAELHQLHLRKALAECLAAEELQHKARAERLAAEAQQELAELLLKKEKY